MIDETSKEAALAALFRALGDPTRLRIFRELRGCRRAVAIDEKGQCRPEGALSVGEVCCRFDQSLSTISHHLRELRLAGLVRTEKQARHIYCSVDPAGLELARAFLEDPPDERCAAAPAAVGAGEQRR